MIKTSLKLTAVAALLAGASVAANAATTDLGAISVGQPTTFSGVVQGSGTSINDLFTFSFDGANTGFGLQCREHSAQLLGRGMEHRACHVNIDVKRGRNRG